MLIRVVTGLLLICSTWLYAATTVPLTVLHFNDEHSMNSPMPVKDRATGKIDTAGGWEYLSGQIEQYRRESERTILLDAGDEFTGGPASALTRGKSQADGLNIMHPDMICVGNHEFDYGLDALQAYQRLFNSDITLASANLVVKSTGKPIFSSGKVVVKNGVRVAMIALTLEGLADVVHPSHLKDIDVLPVVPIAQKFVESMSPTADVIIALTHQGAYEDSVLAAQVPGLDLIVGGHSHSLIAEDFVVNGVRIVQAGSYGRWLGKVELQVDTVENRVVSSTAMVKSVGASFGTPRDERLSKIVAAQDAEIATALDQPVGVLKNDLMREHSKESNLGTWVCGALRRQLGTDIGIYNSGGLRIDLLAGTVLKRHIWQLEPFGNSVAKITVTGAELMRMMEYRATHTADFIQADGLNVRIKNEKVSAISVNGKPLDASATYTIASNTYVVAQWEKYFGFALKPAQCVDLGTPSKDIFIEEFQLQKTVEAKATGWWSVE